jgi:DHA1 family inner membrane transport protein
MKIRSGDQGLTLLLLFLVSLLGEIDYQIIPPLLPLLASTFQTQPAYVGRAVPLYAVAAGICSLLFGYLSDQHGRKPFIQYGLILFSGSASMAYFAGRVELLFLARFLTGVATGGLATCATSYAADFFRYERRGRAMGVLSGAYFAAAIVGVPLVTVVAATLGWRSIFLASSGVAISVSWLIHRFLAANPNPFCQVLDVPSRSKFSRITMLDSLKKKETSAVLLASLLSSGAVVGFITYLGSHLNSALQVPVQRIGFIFLLAGLTSLLGAPLSGIFSDWCGKKMVLVLSGIALTFCLLVIPNLPWGPWFFAAVGFAGLTMAFRMAPLLSIITELVPPRERGTLLALRNTLSQIGIAVSTFVSSYCYLFAGYSAVGLFSAVQVVLSTLLIVFLVAEPNRQSTPS